MQLCVVMVEYPVVCAPLLWKFSPHVLPQMP
jgi:hypothetical protein